MKRQKSRKDGYSTKRQKSLETDQCKHSGSVAGAKPCSKEYSNNKRVEAGSSCVTDSASKCGYKTPKLTPGFGFTKETRKYYKKTRPYGNGCKSLNTNRELNFTKGQVPKQTFKNKPTSSDSKMNRLPTSIRPDNDRNIGKKQELHEHPKNTDISKHNIDANAYDDIDGIRVKDRTTENTYVDNSTAHYKRSESDQTDNRSVPSAVITKYNTLLNNTYPPPRRTHDLETDDLEQDIIIPVDVLDSHLKSAPKGIPATFKNMKPGARLCSGGRTLMQRIHLSGKQVQFIIVIVCTCMAGVFVFGLLSDTTRCPHAKRLVI